MLEFKIIEPTVDDLTCACGRPKIPGHKWCSSKCWKLKEVGRSENNKHRPSQLKSRSQNGHQRYYSKWEHQPIGVDGEGENGRYTLLAGADAKGYEKYIERRSGLSTLECFDFLLDLPRTSRFVWGFGFSYDVNMILVDLTISELEMLRNKTRVYHGDYRIKHIQSKAFTITHRPSRRSVTVWDMYPWVQCSFVNMLENFKLADKTTLDRIAKMKDQRELFADLPMSKIRGYCIEECVLLSRAVRFLMDMIKESGYFINSFYSPGTLAAAAMRDHAVLQYRKDIKDENISQAIEQAYYGGRSEVSTVGPIHNNCYEYDIHSAYPYAATLLPCFNHGKWKRYSQKDEITDWSIVKVKWSTPTDAIWGPFPVRPEVGSLKFPQSGTTWLWGREARIGKQLCKTFRVVEGYHWIPSCKHRPFNYLDKMYATRQELKENKSFLEYIYKLILNSTYGKCAQRHNPQWRDEPKWRFLPWAGLITSITRAMLLEQIITVGSPNVLLCATDCLITTVPLKVNLSDELGDWEQHEYKGMFIAGPGFYFADDGTKPKIRNRGIARANVNFETLAECWDTYGRIGELNLKTRRFIGYKLALQLVDTIHEWRQFRDFNIIKTLTVEPRRQWLNGDVFDGRSIAPTEKQVADLIQKDLVQMYFFMKAAQDTSLDAVTRFQALDNARSWSIFDVADQPDWAIEEMQ